ncbi:hypothetical protein CSUI_006741 [Cystoisospora suis]|uniref:Uncharacterized protein n=1 Tax=Cystoisospora suis TaxID=483139 RepID=A0A2C6KTF2_9APIC|nr:hypothetical protein CSUI_006741 [Cystoisospora suis]
MSPHLSSELSSSEEGTCLDPRFQLFVNKLTQAAASASFPLCSCGSSCTACFDGHWAKDPSGPIEGDELEELARSFRWLQLTRSSFSRKRSHSLACPREHDVFLVPAPSREARAGSSLAMDSAPGQRETNVKVEDGDPMPKKRIVDTEVAERLESVISRPSPSLQCRSFWISENPHPSGSDWAKLH